MRLSRVPTSRLPGPMDESLLAGILVGSPLVLVLVEMLELPDEAKGFQGLVLPLGGGKQPGRLLFAPQPLIMLRALRHSSVMSPGVSAPSPHEPLLRGHARLHPIQEGLWPNENPLLLQHRLLLLQQPIDLVLPPAARFLVVQGHVAPFKILDGFLLLCPGPEVSPELLPPF